MQSENNIYIYIYILHFCFAVTDTFVLSSAAKHINLLINYGATMQSIKILRLKDVIAKTGLSRSTIYELLSAGKFPKPIKLSQRCIGFLEADIDNWLSEKIPQT